MNPEIIFYAAIALFVLLVVLFVQDVNTTLKALSMGGTEKGRLTNMLIDKLGTKAGVYAAKCLAVLVGAFQLFLAYKGEVFAVPVLVACCAFYYKTVKANAAWIKKWMPTVKEWRK